MTCSLFRGYFKEGDGIVWALQHASVIASHYSDEVLANRERLNKETPVVDGEHIMVDGEELIVHVIGDYSNAAILLPVGTPEDEIKRIVRG